MVIDPHHIASLVSGCVSARRNVPSIQESF
jgi:hypothetical protein